jgi:hypothetical protein
VAELGFEKRPIYRLEPDDDLQDLMGALQKTQDPVVIFMDHAEASVLKNAVNLRLLQGYVKEAQRQLMLISKDAIVQALAKEEGIECYASEYQLAEALGLLAHTPSEKPESNADGQEPLTQVTVRRYGLQQVMVLFVAMVAVGLLYYALMPKVTVVVTPGLMVYQQTVEILGIGADDEEAKANSLPVLPLQSVKAVMETEAVVSATGNQALGTAFAKGVAVFINEGSDPVNVPKGTEVKTGEGVVFQTDEAVSVPGRSTEYFLDVAAGVKAGQKEVGITAIKAGEEGNVAAGRIRSFSDSALVKKLVVRNPEPIRGGVSIQQTQVTEEDIKRAEAVCAKQASLKAGEILQAKANPSGLVLIPESVAIEKEGLEPDIAIGEEAQAVKVLARFQAQGQAFKRRDLGALLERELGRQLPEDLVLYQPKFEIDGLVATLADGSITLVADVKAPVHRRLPVSELARRLVGLDHQEVWELGKALDVDSIEIVPHDVGRLPRFAHWIKVEVKVPEAEVAKSQP